MMKAIENILRTIKSDPVLIAAWILAVISAFFVRPGKEYFEYIDFRSLGILWGLMIVVQGLRENSVFEKIGEVLLKRLTKSWEVAAALIFMCFFGSMFITNDVALITFVPFAMMTLHSCRREDMLIPVIVLQTVAANLGSMLMPIGNPQNLYLYGLTGMGMADFIGCMLPYTILSAILLAAAIFFVPGKSTILSDRTEDYTIVKNFGSTRQVIIYTILFVIALMTVLRVIPWYIMVPVILITVIIVDGKILLRADYILLLTFIGFFIFTGNMGKIGSIREILQKLVSGREFYTSIVTSQFISNVPATLLLADYVSDYKELLIGVNVGGLGTLIASMASLISFKAYTNDYKEKTVNYIISFTLVNILFLVILLIFHGFKFIR